MAIEPGMRVKFTEMAFINGVAHRDRGHRKRRGTVIRAARTYPGVWVVLWDDRKTVDRLHQDFIIKETTGCRQ